MSISEKDIIGREEIVNKICGLVDFLGKDKNFCLSLNGEWGSGKSFVLSMIEEKLSQKSEYIVIKYDAWENSFYYEPLIAILSCVIDCLESKLSKMKGYGKVAVEVGKNKVKEIVEKLSESGGKIGFVAKLIKDLTEIVPNFKNVSLATDTKDAQLEIFRSYKSLLLEVKELLNKLTKKVFVENKQTKLAILVDEIDRCLPDEQLKILERLHHLFGVNNCAVIVALNKEQVTNTYAKICGGDGKEYLRKFFDYNFELSMLNAVFFQNELWDNIVENAELKFVEAISKQELEFLQQYIFEKIESHFGSKSKIDNRELERIVKHILSVVKSLPNKKVDYSYLLLISYILCCRLYEKNVFADLKYKKINYLLDIFKNSNIESQILSVHKRFVSSINYTIYNNRSLNTVNYYLNKWAIKDEYMKDTEVDRIFLGSTSSDSCYKQKLEIIFKKIDYIAD